MVAPEHPEALRLYGNCIQSAKLRLDLTDRIVAGDVRVTHPNLGDSVSVELACLQLRKALELIAFASVVASKERYAEVYADFANHWNAKRLLEKLRKVHPPFYPKPVTVEGPDERGVKKFAPVQDGFLTQDEFIVLYDKCSQALHEWNPYRPEARHLDFGRSIEDWVRRIRRLLGLHTMEPVGTNDVWVLELHNPETGNARAWRLVSAPEELGGCLPVSNPNPTKA